MGTTVSMSDFMDFNVAPTVAADDAEHQVQSFVTGAAAVTFNWVTALANTNAARCTVVLVLEASANDCWVRFKASGAAGTTNTNGLIVKVGVPRKFYVDPLKHPLIDCIAVGAGTMQVQVSSPPAIRRYE